MIVQLIHNPGSRSHKPDRLAMLAQTFQACGATVASGETSITGSIAINPDIDLLCVSGGDGALRLVVSALVKSDQKIPICVFPAGTVNLVAREISYSNNPELFAQEVMAGFASGEKARLNAPVIASDAGPFVACLSAGPDSHSVAAISPKLKRYIGGLAYGAAFFKQLVKWPKQGFILTAEIQGQKTTQKCEAFYIAKSRYFAGPWTLTKNSELRSDRFYVITMSSVSRWNYLRFMLALALHRDISKLPFIAEIAAESLSIQSSGSPVFQEDGDMMARSPTVVRMTGQTIIYCLPVAL